MSENKEIETVEEVKVDVLKDNKLDMRTLKTLDLPKMIKIIKKLNLKTFLKDGLDEMFNEDVDEATIAKIQAIRVQGMEEMKGLEEEELEKVEERINGEINYILNEKKNESLGKLLSSLVENIIENYDIAYSEVNGFIGGLYELTNEEVENLDLDVFMACFYNLKNQEKLILFFKTALK